MYVREVSDLSLDFSDNLQPLIIINPKSTLNINVRRKVEVSLFFFILFLSEQMAHNVLCSYLV